MSIGLITLGIFFLVWLFWAPGKQVYLVALAGTAAALATVSLNYCRKWRENPLPDAIPQQHLARIRVVAFLYGAMIGSISPMIYLDGDPQVRLLIAAAVAGAIGTSITISFMPAIAISYTLPIVVQSFFTLAATGEIFSIYVAILEVLYALFMSFLTLFLSALVKKRVIAQFNLKREQALTNLLLNDFEESANDWLWETDDDLRLQHVSDRLSQVAAREKHSLKDMPFEELLAPDGADGEDAFARLHEAITARRAFRDIVIPVLADGERRWWLLSGKPIVVGNSRFSGYRGVGSDITIKKQAEDRLSFLVLHDALTSLPNRVCFQQRRGKASADLWARQTPFTVLCLDLDEFKSVNDTLGHGAGDKLLQGVSIRLKKLLGPKATIARLAGDEFAVLLTGPDASDRQKLADACAAIVTDMGIPSRSTMRWSTSGSASALR